MKIRQNQQPQINQSVLDDDFYDYRHQSRSNLDYFLSSQTPISLNSIYYQCTILQINAQAPQIGFQHSEPLDFSSMPAQYMNNLEQDACKLNSSTKNINLLKTKLCANLSCNFDSQCLENQEKNITNQREFANFSELCNSSMLLKEVKIKGKYQKNTNVPKILVRIFIKHFSSFMPKQRYQLLKHNHMEIKKKLQARQTNNYKIQNLLQLLNTGSSKVSEAASWNRELMSRIILQTMEQEVILNNFVKGNKMSYMIAMKIYALRCRCAALVERVKIL